ncbi:nuclear transport factor 2 family protein [Spirosoma sp. KUDC1026]|uniref:nuclear transport factor 2 family protein n=1 Tax=Spirosoma sp. KUDC1026 TaxID=2745947 RepID=UPI00159BF06F|nr:nuclear transport factor 2 family protein [Spirosoma sp. KUDC1026]QKZ15318.1 nuclear transport factor 2 family protein [Spirosoma sp. KUDC1026]
MDTQLINRLQDTHLAIWNEKDRTRRDAMMPAIYAADIRMYDKDFTLTGTEAISDFIDKLFADDANFTFKAETAIVNTQHGARLFWTIQTGPQPNVLTGMDFFIVENEKIAHLFVFMDPQ